MAYVTEKPVHGRGALFNPKNRFLNDSFKQDEEAYRDLEEPSPNTQCFPNTTRAVFSKNDSPDVGFDVSFNPYRGCEHGCIYCYARPTHEYLGLSAGMDFETKIFVKYDAPALIRKELSSKRWKPQVVAISGVTDAFQPLERRLEVTRQSLAVFAEFRNPVGIITKNFLVTRDIDILKKLADVEAILVYVSVTTLDPKLGNLMEPRASYPQQRLEAIRLLSKAGIPVGVNVAPVIPGLTDHEMPAILKAAKQAGAGFAGYVPVRLPYAVAPLFEKWVTEYFPDRKEKILNRIRSMRDGKLNDSNFGTRMGGKGPFADQINELFHAFTRKLGYGHSPKLQIKYFRRDPQPDLFD